MNVYPNHALTVTFTRDQFLIKKWDTHRMNWKNNHNFKVVKTNAERWKVNLICARRSQFIHIGPGVDGHRYMKFG